jgi:Arc/MetJ-type ribon-helix-helix transcriptional regulator
MDRRANDYAPEKLLIQLADFINEDKYDKLGGFLTQIRRLRRRGVSFDSNMAAPVLEAFTNAISDYIDSDEYNDALETVEDFADFLETLDLPISEESSYRISDAYVRKISERIDSGEYEDAEEWTEDLREFLETFKLTADEHLVSKVINSYTSLIEAYIGAKEYQRADEIKELIGEFKERAEPFKWSTGPKSKAVKSAVKTAGLRCVDCGKELPPGALFCPICGKERT